MKSNDVLPVHSICLTLARLREAFEGAGFVIWPVGLWPVTVNPSRGLSEYVMYS